MVKIFLIHGAFGNSKENWFPWLKDKLEAQGSKVIVPDFPTPENQTLENWKKVFQPYYKDIDQKTIFIGHSLGPLFILNILGKLNQKVKAVFFVAGFLNFLGNKTFDKINKSFVEQDFNWSKVKQNCDNFFVYYSDNDPYIPKEQADKLSKKLGIKPILIKEAGHFNESAGYTKFDRLYGDIKGVLK